MQASKNNNNKRYIDISDTPSGDDTRPLEAGGMIGKSAPMRKLFAVLPKVAGSTSPVIIRGAIGTGKAMIARVIHSLSRREHAPFVAINCAAWPAGLVPAELFGHQKVAVTDAQKRKIGRFELGDGGTILLNEIDGLPRDAQASLLQYLVSPAIDRNGGAERIDVDARIIAATEVDLEAVVEAGRFREDLYHRLNVLSVDVPPLRERGADVQLLADHFYEHFTDEASRYRLMGFSCDARLSLHQWHWPGNVLELSNRVHRAIIVCDNGPISRQDLGLERRAHRRVNMTLDEARDEAEKRAVLNALDRSSGNITVAAERLGVCRMTVYRLMAKHCIEDAAAPESGGVRGDATRAYDENGVRLDV